MASDLDPAPPIPVFTAEPLLDEMGIGEEGEKTSRCKFCRGPVFLDFNEGAEITDEMDADPDFDGHVYDESSFWQHNDDRYSPGKESECGPMEGWASRRD